jgi:hypothetical protein
MLMMQRESFSVQFLAVPMRASGVG